ncbi:MAG TPA: electron transfer flavoprotein subunit beta/FixA family protein [Actinomycetota bacterium]|nr:electron transfer flavoprotein subunit beta/FixA family protein [Actinomycetota bacterium]
MNIAVLVKWVPEPQGTPSLGPDHLLVRKGADGALDPGDEYGLERSLQLVERDGGEVSVVSMGPEVALAAVQRGLAMGASRGVLVTDDALRGADTLVTARVLASALRSAEPDLVVAAVESTDGYTGTLPITLAELLGLPSVTFATSFDVDGAELRAERQTAAGTEAVACSLPALVTVTTGVAEPRYPSLKGVMAAKSKPVDRPSLTDLGLGEDDVRPAQRVVSAEAAPAKTGGRVIEAGPDAAAEIADLLAEARVI